MKKDFVENPVITGDFKPDFYWCGKIGFDSRRINMPHMQKEGEEENRIQETFDIMDELGEMESFTLTDAFNIQNRLLKANNWKGVVPGFRTHNVTFNEETNDTPDFSKVPELTEQLFPVGVMEKEQLLEWYRQIQLVHPFSDLNGRVFGIIVGLLYKRLLTTPAIDNKEK